MGNETALPHYRPFNCDGVLSDLHLMENGTEFITLANVHECAEISLSLHQVEQLRVWLNSILDGDGNG